MIYKGNEAPTSGTYYLNFRPMSNRTIYLETFGCQMNELDSELVAGALRTLGYKFVADPADASVVLYNTCSVRQHAEQKVWSRLGELAERKETEPELVVGVLGCMAERDGVSLVKRMPVVDILCGPGDLDKLPNLLANAITVRAGLAAADINPDDPNVRQPGEISAAQFSLQGNSSRRSGTLAAAEDTLEMLDLSRAISPVDADPDKPRKTAYVRITRGCNKFCTYCVVPFTRGAEVHRPPEHILDECRKLADAGVIEITLLGQTVNHYRFEHGAAVTLGGVMQPQKGRSYLGGHRRDPFAATNVTTFADLLRRIHEEVPAIQRLRFVTSYPRDFGDDVLEVMRDSPRICRYVHVPAQTGSNRLLKMMNRGYTVEEYLEFIDRCRHYLDEPAKGRPLMLSGDFIVGFPTETDEDFEASLELFRKARYKNAFIFKYSPRPGTIAFDKLTDDVPEEVKKRRNTQLLALQSQISDEISKEQIGREFECLVEGYSRRTLKKAGMTSGKLRQQGSVGITIGGRDLGTAVAAPVEEELAEVVQMSSRTEGDQIVMIDVPAARAQKMVGTIVRAKITGAHVLSLQGQLL